MFVLVARAATSLIEAYFQTNIKTNIIQSSSIVVSPAYQHAKYAPPSYPLCYYHPQTLPFNVTFSHLYIFSRFYFLISPKANPSQTLSVHVGITPEGVEVKDVERGTVDHSPPVALHSTVLSPNSFEVNGTFIPSHHLHYPPIAPLPSPLTQVTVRLRLVACVKAMDGMVWSIADAQSAFLCCHWTPQQEYSGMYTCWLGCF